MYLICAEYEHGSQVFVDKIASLAGTYSSMRRTRGDGNCFFRSFIYRYLEWLLQQQSEAECEKCASAQGCCCCWVVAALQGYCHAACIDRAALPLHQP
jgi:hypothetical protein